MMRCVPFAPASSSSPLALPLGRRHPHTFLRMRVIVIADDDSLVGNMENEAADVLIAAGDLWDATIEKARVK